VGEEGGGDLLVEGGDVVDARHEQRHGGVAPDLKRFGCELFDTQVCEPYIRALLNTASHVFEVVVLKLRSMHQRGEQLVCVPPGRTCLEGRRRHTPPAMAPPRRPQSAKDQV